MTNKEAFKDLTVSERMLANSRVRSAEAKEILRNSPFMPTVITQNHYAFVNALLVHIAQGVVLTGESMFRGLIMQYFNFMSIVPFGKTGSQSYFKAYATSEKLIKQRKQKRDLYNAMVKAGVMKSQ